MYFKEQPSYLSNWKAKYAQQPWEGFVAIEFENQKTRATIFKLNQSQSNTSYYKSNEERKQSKFIFEYQFQQQDETELRDKHDRRWSRNYETSMTGDDHESPNNKSRKRTENDDTVENLKEMEEVNNLIQMESRGSNSK